MKKKILSILSLTLTCASSISIVTSCSKYNKSDNVIYNEPSEVDWAQLQQVCQNKKFRIDANTDMEKLIIGNESLLMKYYKDNIYNNTVIKNPSLFEKLPIKLIFIMEGDDVDGGVVKCSIASSTDDVQSGTLKKTIKNIYGDIISSADQINQMNKIYVTVGEDNAFLSTKGAIDKNYIQVILNNW